MLRIFLALQCGKHRDSLRNRERDREIKRERERVMAVTGRERDRASHSSPGRQCVRSGALGPFGWLRLNGCPGEVTRLIENRLRGEGNAFTARLAP